MSMEYKNSTKQEFVDEISLVDIFKVIYKWRKFIILGTLFCTISAILFTYFGPKAYKSTAFFQLSKNNITIDLPEFKKYDYVITSEKRFLDYLKNNEKLLDIDLSKIEKSLTDSQFLDKKIEIMNAYSEEELGRGLSTQQLKNYILGLSLSTESKSPEDAQKFLYIFGNYIKNSIVYVVLYDYVVNKISSANKNIKKYENLIIRTTFNLEQLLKKNKELLVLFKKYPEAKSLEYRQIVSTQEGGYRYLSPVSQLIGVESKIVDLRTNIENYERELKKSKIKLDFFEKAKKYLNENKPWETMYSDINNLKDSMFKSINFTEDKDISEEVLNEISIDFQDFNILFYEVFTFVKQPVLPVKTIKQNMKIIVGATFILSFFILVLLSFFINWWITHKDEIKS